MQFLKDRLQSYLPRPFTCPGCELPTHRLLCQSCKARLRPNEDLIPSASFEIIAYAPLYFAHAGNYSLIRTWKENPGSGLQNLLFRISPVLLATLRAYEFDAVIPIAQAFSRSWKRRHRSALEVGKFFASRLNVPVWDGLQLFDASERQAQLSSWHRAFAPNPFAFTPPPSLLQKVLIVDDFITSGNTLVKAAEAIQIHCPNALMWGASLGYRPVQPVQSQTGVRSFQARQ